MCCQRMKNYVIETANNKEVKSFMGLFIRVRKRLTKDEGINISVSNFTIIFRTCVKCAKGFSSGYIMFQINKINPA